MVQLTSGGRFEIRHPDMIVPTLGMATIGVPAPGSAGNEAERVVHVSLVHITKIEYLPSPSAAGTPCLERLIPDPRLLTPGTCHEHPR